MPDDADIVIDDRELMRDLERIERGIADGRKPLLQFYQDWKAIVGRSWGQMRASGGRFRGRETWKPFADQYTRKTDGVTVPAWGGVPRVHYGFRKKTMGPGRGASTGERMSRVTGNVSGKKRPSGKRVTVSSAQNQDTGDTLRALLSTRPTFRWSANETALEIGGGLKPYMRYVLLDLERNPAQFFPEDQALAMRYCREYVDSLIKG